MNKKRLAICDSEEQYLYALRDYLSSRDTFPFDISIYSNIDSLILAMDKGLIDVLLIQDILIKDIEVANNMLTILLDTGNKTDDIPGIWKYQSAENLRRELIKYYADYRSEVEGTNPATNSTNSRMNGISRSRETTFIGIYTPLGGCLQTTYALLLGHYLGKQGPTLYLNFDAFSGLHNMLSCNEDKDITDLVYYLRSNKDNLIYQLESMVRRIGNLDYMAPASSFIDLASVDDGDWLSLLRTLGASHSYEYVILDLSVIVSGLLDILRECGKVYTITAKDARAKDKLYEYEKLLAHLEYEDILERTRKVDIPGSMNIPGDLQDMEHSELGAIIREIVKEDFYGIRGD